VCAGSFAGTDHLSSFVFELLSVLIGVVAAVNAKLMATGIDGLQERLNCLALKRV
jgi:hypothetical protein